MRVSDLLYFYVCQRATFGSTDLTWRTDLPLTNDSDGVSVKLLLVCVVRNVTCRYLVMKG